jgi:hypothetical protein
MSARRYARDYVYHKINNAPIKLRTISGKQEKYYCNENLQLVNDPETAHEWIITVLNNNPSVDENSLSESPHHEFHVSIKSKTNGMYLSCANGNLVLQPSENDPNNAFLASISAEITNEKSEDVWKDFRVTKFQHITSNCSFSCSEGGAFFQNIIDHQGAPSCPLLFAIRRLIIYTPSPSPSPSIL